ASFLRILMSFLMNEFPRDDLVRLRQRRRRWRLPGITRINVRSARLGRCLGKAGRNTLLRAGNARCEKHRSENRQSYDPHCAALTPFPAAVAGTAACSPIAGITLPTIGAI